MREQGILGAAIDILMSLLDTSGNNAGTKLDQAHPRSISPPASMPHNPINEARRRGLGKFLLAIGRVKKNVSRCLFQLLYYSIRKNSEIQRFAAKKLPVFVTHCEHESVATRCIVEMLSENRELQETEVSVREIKVFIDMLRASPMHPLFLNLL